MSLQKQVTEKIKEAMKNKDTIALESLRAIKSEILLFETKGNNATLTKDDEIKLLQKLVKQRKDSAALYQEQSREDLAEPELAQVKVIAQFLPKPISEEELNYTIKKIITETEAKSMKDMGKIMAIASKNLAGKADGKTIAEAIKKLLS